MYEAGYFAGKKQALALTEAEQQRIAQLAGRASRTSAGARTVLMRCCAICNFWCS